MSEPIELYTPRHPRDEARDEIRVALALSFPQNDPRQLEEYGDSLFAIAEALDIPMSNLKFWIFDKYAGKEFSIHAWRRWCASYVADRDRATPEVVRIEPATPDAQDALSQNAAHALCTHCFATVVQQIDGHWWCSRCGKVQL